ncbi:MAG: translation elongation factor EF-1 subunit alpha [Conexivisphaera sp.]
MSERQKPSKPHLNIVVVGHVDHGKSTLTGHLLYRLGKVDARTIEEYAKMSEKLGAGDTFKFAWVLDRLKEERERGITIDLAFQDFETKKYYWTLIDAPGHRDFVKNMITGASQADAAILVVSAKPGETESALSDEGQAREHAFLLKTLGVNQIVVAINKMDATTPPYDQKRYEEVKNAVTSLLKLVGYKVDKIRFVPVSGWKGDNLVEPSPNTPWYKGPTLVEALDELEEPPKPVDKPLRIPVQDVYSITGVGTVPVGRVETGILKVGDTVVIMPSGAVGEVKSIETHHTPIQEALPGDNIGFNIRGVSKDDVKRGYVVGHLDNPPTVVKEFVARIIVVFHPTAFAAGYTPVLHAHTAQVPAQVTELLQKLDPRTGQVTEENPKSLKTGDAAVVKIRPLKPLSIEEYKSIPQLGRFALRDSGRTIAAGVVEKITEVQEIKIKK